MFLPIASAAGVVILIVVVLLVLVVAFAVISNLADIRRYMKMRGM